MRRLKLYLTLTISVLSLFGIAACSTSDVVKPDDAIHQDGAETEEGAVMESLTEKIKRVSTIKGIKVYGSINVVGRGKDVQGEFVMSIDGDDMDMVIFSKGVTAGSIDLKGNSVIISRPLNDEYIEYMFAVILRDAVTWWNIREYDITDLEMFYVLRNSWKKIYINSVSLVPEKQVIRLTKQREIVITYSDVREFGFGIMPSTISFGYNGLQCRLSVERLEVLEIIRQSSARDQSRRS